MSLLLRVLASLFFLGGWLAPNHYLPWTSFHNEAPIFMALIALCLATLTVPKSVYPPKPAIALVAILLGVVCIQTTVGQIMFMGDALVSSLFLIAIAVAWWLGARQVFVSSDFDRALIWAAMLVVIAAALSAFLALLQWLQLEPSLGIFAVERGPGMRPSGNVAQPNLLATLLVMGIVFTNLLFVRGALLGWQAGVLAVFLSFILVATESRAGLLSAFGVGVFFAFRAKSLRLVGAWRIVGAWWALLLLFFSIWGPLNNFLLLQPARQTVAGVDSVRLVLWKQAIAAIVESPWIGFGWRQTAVAQKFGVLAAPGDVTTDYAHSVVLDVIAWVGLPFGIALLFLIGWWILRTARNAKNSTELLLFSATIPFFLHSLVEFPFAYALFLFPVAGIFGMLQALQAPSSFRVSDRAPVGMRIGVFCALLGFSVVCGKVMLEYLDAEDDMRVMRFELRNVGTRPVDYAAPHLLLLTQLDEMLTMGRIKPRRNMSLDEIERMRKANLSLSWATLHMNYIVALGLNGNPQESAQQLRILRGLYGPITYAQAKGELITMRDQLYPELMLIKIP